MPHPALSRVPALTAAALALAACQSAAPPGTPGGRDAPRAPGPVANVATERFADAAPARAELRDVEGRTVGTATLTQATHGLVLALELTGVTPGVHALHVHDVGRCEPPFTSAGGHYNPTLRAHGIRAANGQHSGDLPNVTVPASGSVRVELFTRDLQLGTGVGTLFDRDGSALMLHSGSDDYVSDPAGNAGTRYACGVISR